MRTRKSQGKERPSLPRAGELRPIETVGERSEDRAAAGRFRKGNKASQGAGPKRVIAKATSTDGLAHDEAIVAKDTRRLMLATLREVPGASDSTIVRTNAYGFARESSLAAYYDAKANAAGLATPSGIELAERATSHRRVAERLSVTLLAEAATLAKSKPAPSFPWLTSGSSSPEQPDDEDRGEVEQPEDDDEPAQSELEPIDDPEPGIRDSRESLPSEVDRIDPVKASALAASRLTPNSTAWSHSLGRLVPVGSPAPAQPQPSPLPSPATRKHASPATPPLPRNMRMVQDPTGCWRPGPPPEPSRPSPTALRQMREKGIDTSRWEP